MLRQTGVSFNKVRQEALSRAKYRCERCGGAGEPVAGKPHRLEVHHRVALRYGGSDELDNLMVLCIPCHVQLGHENGTWDRSASASPVKTVAVSLYEDESEWLKVLAGRFNMKYSRLMRQGLWEMAYRMGLTKHCAVPWDRCSPECVERKEVLASVFEPGWNLGG